LANHKSALKRAKQSETKRLRNKMVKTKMKNVIKMVNAAKEQNPEDAAKTLDMAKSVIDKAAKKGVIHNNTAARKISRLTKLINTISA